MTKYEEYITRKRKDYGDRFSEASLAPQFVRYFNSGQRIEVVQRFADGTEYRRRGTVGVTTGWIPAFLLMHRSNQVGSSDVLTTRDEIVCIVPTPRRRSTR